MGKNQITGDSWFLQVFFSFYSLCCFYDTVRGNSHWESSLDSQPLPASLPCLICTSASQGC